MIAFVCVALLAVASAAPQAPPAAGNLPAPPGNLPAPPGLPTCACSGAPVFTVNKDITGTNIKTEIFEKFKANATAEHLVEGLRLVAAGQGKPVVGTVNVNDAESCFNVDIKEVDVTIGGKQVKGTFVLIGHALDTGVEDQVCSCSAPDAPEFCDKLKEAITAKLERLNCKVSHKDDEAAKTKCIEDAHADFHLTA